MEPKFKHIKDFLVSDDRVEFLYSGAGEKQSWDFEFNFKSDSEVLKIELKVPSEYPHATLRFLVPEKAGGSFCLPDGQVCLVPPYCPDPADQWKEDWKGLMDWIDEFVVGKGEQGRYDYPVIPRLPIYMIFEESRRDKELRPGQWGDFLYSKTAGSLLFLGGQAPTYYAQNLGSRENQWSTFYKQETIPRQRGLWCFLGEEPVKENRSPYETWEEIMPLLPTGLKKDLNKLQENFTFSDLGPFIPLMIGYYLPGETQNEIHWEFIMALGYNQNSLDVGFSRLNQLFGTNFPGIKSPDDLFWGTSMNASYDRFFGRGRLCSQIRNARIMILGLGAIGGSLAEILTRGGCKKLALSDADKIEPGNVCRSVYPFISVNRQKTKYLADRLLAISPFIEVGLNFGIAPQPPGHPNWREIQKELNKYDYIFDCTANNRLAWMLDQMNLEATVINFSLTDEAKEFICIAGVDSISIIKENFLNEMGTTSAQDTFYEGAGCWHPTFRASFPDINAPLNMAVCQLNEKIEGDQYPTSFFIKKSIQDGITNWNLSAI